ncbi:MAG: hypothetical protein QXG99_08200 [Conexivisphaerales archaeon]
MNTAMNIKDIGIVGRGTTEFAPIESATVNSQKEVYELSLYESGISDHDIEGVSFHNTRLK